MQPSKERDAGEATDAGEGDPLDDLDDLLDDDLAGGGSGVEEGSAAGTRSGDSADSTAPADASSVSGSSGSGRVGVDGRWFSLKAFGVTLLAVALATVLVGLVPLIGGTIGAVAGVLIATFLVGLLFSSSNYVETGLAGALAGAGTAVSSVLGVGFLPIGIDYLGQWGLPLLAVGGGVGLLCGLVGHYFGRDLRSGVTGDLPE
ncbi:hypothetical protein SAMN04488066_11630 [Halorubrum aquaticum]|uniref:Uncharacterized protein n=1 Tax=Halorubrum aquaticum TaxID=387340 RepID=A0A1I3BX15_9EURY|nr:hypothetical protein [Halorubrum aquaticum]SFH66844.1 hypothetical protein SAMN04488066_11630 [Halorubrum aquaticum]